jgi:hypothetical protein
MYCNASDVVHAATIFENHGEVFHAPRLCGIAALDMMLTYVAAIWIASKRRASPLITFAWLLAAGTCMHCVFGVSCSFSKLHHDQRFW